MVSGNSIKSILLIIVAAIILSACATKTTKKVGDYKKSKVSKFSGLDPFTVY